MLNKSLALERLNQDKNYEDKLIIDLGEYFLDCLDSIPGLTNEDKDKIKLTLNRIIDDSKTHSLLFNQLIDTVLENADDKF